MKYKSESRDGPMYFKVRELKSHRKLNIDIIMMILIEENIIENLRRNSIKFNSCDSIKFNVVTNEINTVELNGTNVCENK